MLQCEVIELGNSPIRDVETRQAVGVAATAAAAAAATAAAAAVLAASASC